MVIKLLGWGIGLYVLAMLAGYVGQRRLLYVPDRMRTDPASAGLSNVAEVAVAAPDGISVLAWYGRAQPGQPTILYFHGNGGSLLARVPRIERFMAEGWGVMMMTYRGYGGSGGAPTERDNVADAVRTYDVLTGSGVTPDRIVLYGESLGTGVAAQVARLRPAAGLILDAPYTSIPDVAARVFWFMPVQLLMRDRYETRGIIGQIAMPILILHGARDATIPVAMGRALAAAASARATYVEFPRGGHSDLYINGNDALAAVRTFLHALKVR